MRDAQLPLTRSKGGWPVQLESAPFEEGILIWLTYLPYRPPMLVITRRACQLIVVVTDFRFLEANLVNE